MPCRLKRGQHNPWKAGIVGLWLLLTLPATGATVHRVPEDFPTPAQALQIAQPGDRVRIGPGQYAEPLIIPEGITLEGVGPETVFRQTLYLRDVADVQLRRFRLQGGSNEHHFGIVAENAEALLEDVTVIGFHHGISGEGSRLRLRRVSVSGAFDVGVLLVNSVADLESVRLTNNPGRGLHIAGAAGTVRLLDATIAANDLVGVQLVGGRLWVRRTRIADNGLGLLIESGEADLGNATDPGRNVLADNRIAEIQADQSAFVEARGNFWGSSHGPDPGRVPPHVPVRPWLSHDPSQLRPVQPAGLLPIRWAVLRSASPKTSPLFLLRPAPR